MSRTAREPKSASVLDRASDAVSRGQSGRGDQAKPAPIEGRIGVVGLGRMGTAMAANLVVAGREVIGYVRRPERAKELVSLGLDATSDVADLSDCEIVISMLPDDAAVREVVYGRERIGTGGLADRLMPGAIHLSMSTISPAAASELARAHAQRGQRYVAAPVFGNPDAAKARELFIIAAGAAADIKCCQPIFDVLGQRTFVVGNDPAPANLIKLAGNAMSAAGLEILSEILTLARKRGADPQQVLTILTETMHGSRFNKIYGDKIARAQYAPGNFAFPLVLKDIRLALNEAETAGVPMPAISVVRDRLISGIARGYSRRDWSALGMLAATDAGLIPEPEKTSN
jgi:3-hydroxyisobutyrate dehydrogenase-like beta-hydroxyacid dehydrogenase